MANNSTYSSVLTCHNLTRNIDPDSRSKGSDAAANNRFFTCCSEWLRFCRLTTGKVKVTLESIACIGNADVDTQLLCHPSLSVAVNDLESARELAIQLKEDKDFYNECSEMAKANYEACFSKEVWLQRIKREL